jgi:hypothetical protein
MTTCLAPAPVTIREATPADEPALLTLLVNIALTSPYTVGTDLNRPHLAAMLHRLLHNPDAGFLVAERDGGIVGLVVLMLFEDLISGERGASQVTWYVLPSMRYGLGLRLLDVGEQWAKARGAEKVQMLSPEPKFDAVLARRGYVPTNRVMERRI